MVADEDLLLTDAELEHMRNCGECLEVYAQFIRQIIRDRDGTGATDA